MGGCASCKVCCVGRVGVLFFFFKQKTAYEMRISDWSSDVCSSDLAILIVEFAVLGRQEGQSVWEAAVNAARLRFRPIVMTSLAFIAGVVPLAVASGSGAGSRHSIGPGVIDRKSVVLGHSVSVLVVIGGRRILKKHTMFTFYIYTLITSFTLTFCKFFS